MICLYLIFYRFWSTCEKDWPSLVNKKLLKENLINQFLAELFWEEQKLLQNVFYDRKKWTYFFTSKYGLLKKLLKGKGVSFEFLQSIVVVWSQFDGGKIDNRTIGLSYSLVSHWPVNKQVTVKLCTDL